MLNLDGFCDQGADEVHEAQVCVAVSDQSSSGQRHAWFLEKRHKCEHKDRQQQ